MSLKYRKAVLKNIFSKNGSSKECLLAYSLAASTMKLPGQSGGHLVSEKRSTSGQFSMKGLYLVLDFVWG